MSEGRATEAEELRDALGRRVDVLEAANRCARALGSSLVLEEAFGAFIREVRGLVPFDRIAVVLVEGNRLEVLATAGEGARKVFPPGSVEADRRLDLRDALGGADRLPARHARQAPPRGERARSSSGFARGSTAPLLVGSTAVGLISFVRREPDAFSAEEVELVSLIGRLAATAVQNIRAYDAEHRTVEELRRLSALRADFVSLVSHELRSPMAAVIGAAQTLQQRWRELSPEQRAVVPRADRRRDEQARRAHRATCSTRRASRRARSPTGSTTSTSASSPRKRSPRRLSARTRWRSAPSCTGRSRSVRGDRVRLRQVLANLIENAVKWSQGGEHVDVDVSTTNGRVVIGVRDRGPGIPREEHGVIFEKFGRAKGGAGRSGTGLGLFIARSIAEAHGGTVDVRSVPGQGATFTLTLPWPSVGIRIRLTRSSAASCFRAVADVAAQVLRLQDDRVAAVREDLALEPLGAADRQLGDGRSVGEPAAHRVRSPSGRRPSCRERAPCARRAAGSARSPRAARTSRRAASPRASGRAGSCARRRASDPTCARASWEALARASTARRFASTTPPRLLSDTRPRRGGGSRIAVLKIDTKLSSSPPTCGSGVCTSSNCPNVSSSFLRTRASGVCASAAIIGPTYSSASRIARASSGVRRGAARNVSP